MSQKYALYSNQASHLRAHGMGKSASRRLLASQSEVVLKDHWLEAFWCKECQTTEWYHIRKTDRNYQVSLVPPELWQRAIGVTESRGNPSVGEFTRKHAHMAGKQLI